MKKAAVIAALLASVCFPPVAYAWDEAGHRITALIADHYLTPAARNKVNALLAADKDTLADHDIASAATWADKFRDSDAGIAPDGANKTENWHFALIEAAHPNIPGACFGQPALPPGTAASAGPAKACVIDKINQFAAELADPKIGESERILALKYLLNLVGDAHQPLHVTDEGDGHGTKTRVKAKTITPGELYNYWNSSFVTGLGVNPVQVAGELIAKISDKDAAAWSTGAPHLWALEAHQLGVDLAYGMLGNLDDKGNSVLQDAEVQRAQQTIATQLSRAGVRLAYLINESVAPSAAAAAKKTKGDPATGRTFAMTACSVCHVVAPDQKNPKEFTTAPDFQSIANTRGLTDTAIREFLFGSHPTMPKMKLSRAQADNVVAYFGSLRGPAK